MHIYDLVSEFESQLEEFIKSHTVRVNADNAGLDVRAGSFQVGEDCIIAKHHQVGPLNYYGGFEYVADECKTRIGEYHIFYNESERVQAVIDFACKTARENGTPF